jgi:thiamine transport system ATP-binding protein
MVSLEIVDVTVRFDDATAVDAVSLTVAPGEIVALLGPSGCGKSTLLRVVAGLQRPDHGSIRHDGSDITHQPAHERNIGLMFQDHALFPHRRVAENVAFGVRMRGASAAEQRARVEELLALVGLEGYERRTVDTLSGGEAQRVALARALAPRPSVLLLDEPFGSLDRNRRDELTIEVGAVLRATGQAAIHVTHDHDEAFAIADRVAVMEHGRLVRVGPPVEVWRHPDTVEVARFLGHHNIVSRSDVAQLGVSLPASAHDASMWLVRPDAIDVDDSSLLRATVRSVRFAGAVVHTIVQVVPDGPTLALVAPQPRVVGAEIGLRVDPVGVVPLSS